MGEVDLAEHVLLKRPCAVKLIRAVCAASAAALERFEREVQLTAALSHPNIVDIYDYGRAEDGTYYYVMEYLNGLTLAELVERHGELPPGRVVYLLRQVCEALREAHAADLIHRDLKPSNIFAARRGQTGDVAKLLDFGLVLPRAGSSGAHLSGEGQILGTPLYMSPEQATGGRELDGRSDLYSLGAVAYFLLTGRPPFDREDGIAALIAHARDPVVPPSRFRARRAQGSGERRPPLPGQGPRRAVLGCRSPRARLKRVRLRDGLGPGSVPQVRWRDADLGLVSDPESRLTSGVSAVTQSPVLQ